MQNSIYSLKMALPLVRASNLIIEILYSLIVSVANNRETINSYYFINKSHMIDDYNE